jgi:hypothetical protein
MSSIQNVSPEELAKLFHLYHRALTHGFDEDASHEIASSWDKTPQSERKVMVAAARLALLDLATASERPPKREYFAEPGEADWGC